MITRDVEYYRRRERQERENAERADDNTAKRIHLDLANRYSAMLREISLVPVSAQA
ncbi:MAG: hypothetical protein ABW023_04240 [Sphingomonas sp.]